MTENTQEEQILVFQPARIIKFTKCVLGEGGVSGGRKHVVACLYDQKSMWGVQIPTQIYKTQIHFGICHSNFWEPEIDKSLQINQKN